jgi:hypothetical protein
LGLVVKEVETIIPVLPRNVKRLSVFDSGQALLLQTENGIFVLDVTKRKVIPVLLPTLHDEELDLPVGAITDGWAGPTATEITFSGQTTDSSGKIRRRIYSCGLNGSNLRAWTPATNLPAELFEFTGNRNVPTIANEWALAEILYEDDMQQRLKE